MFSEIEKVGLFLACQHVTRWRRRVTAGATASSGCFYETAFWISLAERTWLARRRLVRQRKLLEVRARKRATIARESRKVYCVEAHRKPEVSC